MRKSIILFLLLFLSKNALAITWCEDTNAQGCYLAQEGSGTSLNDSTSNNRDITLTTPSWSSISGTNSPIYSDYEIDFNGTSDYGYTTVPGYGTASFVAWVKVLTLPSSGERGYVLTFSNATNIWGSYDHSMEIDDAGHVYYATYDGGTSSTVSGGTLTVGTWYHLAVTSDGTDNYIYINGSQDGHFTGGNTNSFGYFNVGGDNTYANAETYLNFAITEIAFFNRVLNSTEITDIKNDGLSAQQSVGGGSTAKSTVVWF